MLSKVVTKSTTVDGKVKINLGQPTIEEAFEDLNINAEEELLPENLIGIDLSDGVTLETNQQGTTPTLLSKNEGESNLLQYKGEIPNSDFGDYRIRVKINADLTNLLPESESKELKLTGNYALINPKVNLNVNQTNLNLNNIDEKKEEKIRSFGLKFKTDQETNIGLNLKYKGLIEPKEEKEKKSFVSIEGVDRKGRITLATLTYQIGFGFVKKGDGEEFAKVPIGVTVIIISTLEGKADINLGLSFSDYRSVETGVTWDKDNGFETIDTPPTVYKSEINGSLTGETQLVEAIGSDIALNIGGILPAVLQNDIQLTGNLKGDANITFDLTKEHIQPELQGCIQTGMNLDFLSTFKGRIAIKFFVINEEISYTKEIIKRNLYNNELKICNPSGKVTGIITDKDTKEKLLGVTVTAYQGDVVEKSTTTDENGAYTLELFPGTYTVTYEKDGYTQVSTADISLEQNTVDNNISLQKIQYIPKDFLPQIGKIYVYWYTDIYNSFVDIFEERFVINDLYANSYKSTNDYTLDINKSGDIELVGQDTEYVLLKTPIEVGNKWYMHEITSVNLTITTKAGTFKNVIEVKTNWDNTEDYIYFAEGVGVILVKSNGKIVQELMEIN